MDIANRQEKRLSDFYINYKPALLRFTAKFLKTNIKNPLVEDMVHEGIVKVIKNIDSYDPSKSSLYTWTCNIIKNTTINYLEKAKREIPVKNMDQNVNIKVETNNIKKFIERVKGPIDIEEYSTWLLSELGFNYLEIGNIIGVSKRQVGYRMKKFKNKYATFF